MGASVFCGFGVMAGFNLTSVVALELGAFAVATAIFLILELNRPFSGLLHVPPMSIEATRLWRRRVRRVEAV
jgi:hypothetical protein